MDPVFERKDDVLWAFIARATYTGLLTYVGLIFFSVFRDLFRRNSARRRSKNAFRRSKYSLVVLHNAFLSRYRDTNLFYYVELMRLSANLVVCITYIVGTYHQNVSITIYIIQRSLATLFSIDLILRIWYVESAVSAMFSISSFLEAMSFPSLFMANGPADYLNYSFLRSIPAYRAYSRLERRVYVASFSQERLLIRLSFLCLTLFYTLAAGIQLLEIPGDLLTPEFRQRWFQFSDWNFFNSCYFVIVTLSTVGYGDFSPSTVQGRFFTFFMIIVGIVIFTSAISEIVERSQNSRGSGTFVKRADTRHVIVAGTPTVTDLVHFVSEFYADIRHTNVNAKVVVLVEDPKWTDREWFHHIAKNQFLQSRLQFLIGSVRNEFDLHRARINSADAVFFLISPSTGEDPSFQDTRTVMNTLAIRNIRTDIPIYSQVLLQDSNVQMHIALKTACSVSRNTFFRDTKEMTASAQYQGLFQEVLRNEYQTIPRTHVKKGLRSLEDVLAHYSKVHKGSEVHKEQLNHNNDLERSEFVCLQELHMALISANVKANGVGTLLSNMYLDVQSHRIEGDPAWLTEYHMGASCSLSYAIIPEDISGVTVREISGDLFHLGLVLIATKHPLRSLPEPVLTTDRFLRGGDVAMFLTYHHSRYVASALQIIVRRFKTNSLRHPIGHSITPRSQSSSILALGGDTPEFGKQQRSLQGPVMKSELVSQDSDARDLHHAITSPLRPNRRLASSFRAPYMNLSRDGSTPLTLNPASAEFFASSFPESPSMKTPHKSAKYMPDNLAGHVIVAMEGDAPLKNLPLLLRNLWHKDKRKSLASAVRERVVVIHPNISESYRSRFEQFERKCLFFVEGSPASQHTWVSAKLGTARSVCTMADYTQPWYISDARTIFTFMTLDVSTLNDQDVFVCSELVDEKSLEFLREPSHPRRVGALLGEPNVLPATDSPTLAVNEEQIKQESPLPPAPTPPPSASIPQRIAAKAKKVPEKLRLHSSTESPSDNSQTSISQQGTSRTNPAQSGESNVAQGNNISRSQSERPPLLSMGTMSSLAHGLKNVLNTKETAGDVSPRTPPESPLLASAKQDADDLTEKKTMERSMSMRQNADGSPNSAQKYEAAKERRGTLFSRSRYASGELLIHSSAIALLIREYLEPGFVHFYSSLLGADASCSGLKVRLVRIPKSMFDEKMSLVRKDGKKLVRYSAIFKSLVRHGATPLGIYRSGNAPVLIPSKPRRKRGVTVYKEAMALLAEDDATVETDDFVGKSNTFDKAKRFMEEQIKKVAPSKIREARGRDAIQGTAEFSGSSSESSSDAEDDADYDKIHEFDNASLRSFASPHSPRGRIGHLDDDGPTSPRNEDLRPMLQRTEAKHHSMGGPEFRPELSEFQPSSMETPMTSGGTDPGPTTQLSDFLHRIIPHGEEHESVMGGRKFKEVEVPGNHLPYVYTLPDPNTWCAESDGIFILMHPSLDLPLKWSETTNAALEEK